MAWQRTHDPPPPHWANWVELFYTMCQYYTGNNGQLTRSPNIYREMEEAPIHVPTRNKAVKPEIKCNI